MVGLVLGLRWHDEATTNYEAAPELWVVVGVFFWPVIILFKII